MLAGAAIFLVAAFGGNTTELGWRILAIAGWIVGMIGIGIYFYDFIRLMRNR